MDTVMARMPEDRTEGALADAARVGDRTAFSVLVERHRGVAFAYAYARLRDREEAEDIAQEAFVRAYQALPRLRTTTSWTPWMMRILRNLCNDALRKRRVRKTEPLDPEWVDGSPSPEMLALTEERRRELSAGVAALPEKYRVPLLMRYASGLAYREIALALEVPESTVVGRLAQALRRLRRRMTADQ